MPYQEAGVNLMSASEGYSLWQVLMQSMMNWIQEFSGTDREATLPWLDHVEAIARKMGFDPLEVDMSKLKGTTLGDVNTVSKDGNLMVLFPSVAHYTLLKHPIHLRCP